MSKNWVFRKGWRFQSEEWGVYNRSFIFEGIVLDYGEREGLSFRGSR